MSPCKITELLCEVDQRDDFTRHFINLHSDMLAKDRSVLLKMILTGAINPGLTKMVEAYPRIDFYKLDMSTRFTQE